VPIYDTFTKRKRAAAKAAAGSIDVYQYDSIPAALRTQVAYIWTSTIGAYREIGRYDFSGPPPCNERWEFIRDLVARERGVFSLSPRTSDNPLEQCAYVLLHGSADDALEIIEASFRLIERVMADHDDWQRQQEGLTQNAAEAIAELNGRFREHGVGYRFENGTLIRVDSELLHEEVTKPALRLLHVHGFEGALQEFMSAHEHYRRGEAKDANVDALNALESTLKTICDERKWKYPGTATATDLVKIVVGKSLIPAELQGQFDHLIRAMKTGLPPVRHNFGGHGQGAEVKKVSDHLAAYSLHLMASNIVLLIEAHRAVRK
jgi:hypothetical protein